MSFAIRRLVGAIVVLFSVISATFLISHLLPSNPAAVAAGPQATPDQIKATAHDLGLDQPLATQYLNYLRDLSHGDMGISYQSRAPVTPELMSALPATVELVLWGFTIYVVIGIGAGIIWAAYPRSFVATALRLVTSVFIAAPVFWVAIVLQLLIAGRLGLLPINGRFETDGVPPIHITGLYVLDSLLTFNFGALGDALAHLVLPVATLVIWMFAVAARITQKSISVEMHRLYVRIATAKGLTQRRILLKHVLRNAISPVISVIGLQLGWLFGGTIMVEVVYSWPGIGTYLYSALQAFDFPAITAVTIVVTVAFVVANLLVDLSYPLIDPRVRAG